MYIDNVLKIASKLFELRHLDLEKICFFLVDHELRMCLLLWADSFAAQIKLPFLGTPWNHNEVGKCDFRKHPGGWPSPSPDASQKGQEGMKGKDWAGREDLSVEQLVLSTFVSGGRQLMRLKLLHNLVSRPPQTLH